MSRLFRHAATLVAALAGLAGVLLLLFAWHLPPFSGGAVITEDAYVRGRVTSVAPRAAGLVAEVPVQDFETVRKGDLLARLDDRIAHQKLAQAEATLAEARAALDASTQDELSAKANVAAAEASGASAAAAVEVARANRDRARELLSRGVSTRAESDQIGLAYDQAEAARRQAGAELEALTQKLRGVLVSREALRAAVASAEAARELARSELDDTEIRAPADGRLGEIGARVGQYVSAGTRVATLVPGDVWVIANFKETQIAGMREGQPVSFTVDAIPGARFTGHVERFSPAAGSEFSAIRADNATGNVIKVSQRVPVRVAVDPGQPGAERLAPGLSVVARVEKAAPAS